MTPESMVKVLLLLTVALNLLAWLLLLVRQRYVGFGMWCVAWLVNLTLIGINWIICGEPPMGNMYHVLTLLGACFLPLYVFVDWRDKLTWMHVYFAFAAAIPLVGSLFMGRDVHWKRMPALQSPWFVPHVFAYMLSYALAAVAFAATIMGIVTRKLGTAKHDYRTGSYQVLRLAFPLMTFGMLSGALWAEEAWGVYWSWDPKETWSLVTWSCYVVYFHCRTRPSLHKFEEAAEIAAFLALLTTFTLVNLLPKLSSALHSYA